MYYNEYDEYMKSVLGYPNLNDNTYCSSCNYRINYNDMDYNNYTRAETANIEQMYPEIYRIINPMVCKACDNNTQPVTEYLIEQMTDDIYDNAVKKIEVKNVINLNIETRSAEDVNQNTSNISKTNTMSTKSTLNSVANAKQSESTSNNRSIESESTETRSPVPRRRNTLLRDLIRILIINRFLRNRRPGPNRPPFRPGPQPIGPRPPMPGGPGFGPRPPMPRFDEYEW